MLVCLLWSTEHVVKMSKSRFRGQWVVVRRVTCIDPFPFLYQSGLGQNVIVGERFGVEADSSLVQGVVCPTNSIYKTIQAIPHVCCQELYPF
jgi:hypothetical protein